MHDTHNMDESKSPFSGRLSDGDIRLLRVFCTVVQRGGFAAAESELQIGLPSISRYIKDLETRFGMRLCQRGRVGFSLTERGAQIYAASLRLLENVSRFESEVRGAHGELSGTLSIGVVDSLVSDPQFMLRELIEAFKSRHPMITIEIMVRTSNIIEQAVLDGSIQAGFVFGRRNLNKLEKLELYNERNGLYCSGGHPLAEIPDSVTPDMIGHYDYAGYSFISDPGRFASDEAKGLLRKTAGVDHLEALVTLIETGKFIGFLPEHYVRSFWRCADFKPILPSLFTFDTAIALVTLQGTASPVAAAFDKVVKQQLQVRKLQAP